ncbi:hypothetical protein Tco_0358911 [Tanacetum coccineum]
MVLGGNVTDDATDEWLTLDQKGLIFFLIKVTVHRKSLFIPEITVLLELLSITSIKKTMVRAADLELEFNQYQENTNARLTTLENELAAMRLEANQRHEQSNQRHEQSTKMQEEMMRMMTELLKKNSDEVESTKGFRSYDDLGFEIFETSTAGEKKNLKESVNSLGSKKVEFGTSSVLNGTNNSFRENENNRNVNW